MQLGVLPEAWEVKEPFHFDWTIYFTTLLLHMSAPIVYLMLSTAKECRASWVIYNSYVDRKLKFPLAQNQCVSVVNCVNCQVDNSCIAKCSIKILITYISFRLSTKLNTCNYPVTCTHLLGPNWYFSWSSLGPINHSLPYVSEEMPTSTKLATKCNSVRVSKYSGLPKSRGRFWTSRSSVLISIIDW